MCVSGAEEKMERADEERGGDGGHWTSTGIVWPFKLSGVHINWYINRRGKLVLFWWPTNHPQNADEIDKKLKTQEESLRKISEGSSIGEEEDSFKPNFIYRTCFWYVRAFATEDLPQGKRLWTWTLCGIFLIQFDLLDMLLIWYLHSPLRESVLGHGEAAREDQRTAESFHWPAQVTILVNS